MKDLNGSEKDEMLTLMEEIQTENEELQTENRDLLKRAEELEKENKDLQESNTELESKNSEARRMISELSSQNSKLQNVLQKKSAIIVSLNERIEKLSGSDLVLKQNEELRKQNEVLRKNAEDTKRKAETMVSACKEQAGRDVETVKAEYKKKEAGLADREQAAFRREKRVSEREKDIRKEIDKKAEKITSESLKKHQSEFNKLRTGYQAFVFFTLLYGILITMLSMCKTDVFVNDFISLMHDTGRGLKLAWGFVGILGEIAASAGNMIPQAVVAMIVHWILWGIFTVIFIAISCFMLFIAGSLYIDILLRKQADEISLFIGIVDLAVAVSMADEIKMLIPCNLILVMLTVFVAYTVIRGIIQTEYKEERNIILKWSAIVLGIISALALVFRLFGYKGIGVIVFATILAALNRQNGVTY